MEIGILKFSILVKSREIKYNGQNFLQILKKHYKRHIQASSCHSSIEIDIKKSIIHFSDILCVYKQWKKFKLNKTAQFIFPTYRTSIKMSLSLICSVATLSPSNNIYIFKSAQFFLQFESFKLWKVKNLNSDFSFYQKPPIKIGFMKERCF